MRNLMMSMAYDGTRYLGWQKTNLDAIQPSIEYVVQTTLEKILQHPVPVQAASRTDRGVHAEGQVINIFTNKEDLDLDRLQHSLNCLLPADIRILTCSEAPELSFHATLSAKAKQYVYRICTGKTLLPFLRYTHWHLPDALDREKMELGAEIILGEHDFLSLRNHRKGKDYNDTVRNVMSIDFQDVTPDILEIKVTANNFLYKMCRNIIGTLVWVGLGKISPGTLAKTLSGGTRSDAGITAPAQGLSLSKVFYSPVCPTNNQLDML